MRPAHRIGLAALILAGALGSQTASAQYYEDGYGRPMPRRAYDYDDRDVPPPPRRGYYEGRERPTAPRRATGLNCDAVQSGFTGPKPYSCPLPGPRPLGARCFCDMPISPMSGPQTAVGRVVP
ncbi:hypothetical protein G3T14_02360 [Methylobacterium sp. BTF04]|uniref:hypothetical protein n=1 Tax=Methylobacterium sp. BTF04 TaxID=2708300 RepID=UPI0013D0EBFC|nr:hypothetical protein [Methylobacterium sp. BTF04]NEU10975.1 hypothetical protein [Methylobacterium sp. BTF04]